MSGVGGRLGLPHFLLRLFVSRPKRFRHTRSKTKTKAAKYKSSQMNDKKTFYLSEN